MWRTHEGSTGQLIKFCLAYFFFYVITGVTVKYFTSHAPGSPALSDMAFTTYSTLGGTMICLSVVLALRWYRMASNQPMAVAGLHVPGELLYIIPSGICTAVVIPTTTLMYTLPINVMVGMVIMRGSVIVVSRVVDTIQIAQGILKKKVYWQENVGVVVAIVAVAVQIFWAPAEKRQGSFDFVANVAAMTILGSYIVAYAVRIYIMNYYKNTRGKGVKQDNKGFFALEQISAALTLAIAAFVIYNGSVWFGWNLSQITDYHDAVARPSPWWTWAALAGTAFGFAAFFSVFLFMFKGRTATFAGLVNRLTSLVAGTAATLVSWLWLNGKAPKTEDWVALGFILLAVGFLTLAEKRRAQELEATHEVEGARAVSDRLPKAAG